MSDPRGTIATAIAAALILFTAGAQAQEVKHYRFAYDQPKTTGYGILGDIFAEKVQARIISEGVTIPLGQYVQPMARRKNVSGNVASPVTVFWNVEKK